MIEWFRDLGLGVGAFLLAAAIAFGPAFLYGLISEKVFGVEAKDWVGGVLIVLGPLISIWFLLLLSGA